MPLHQQHCDPSTKPSLLSKEQISDNLIEIPLWNSETTTTISRSFKFKNYQQTLLFVNASAKIAEQENHHPNISFGYNTCFIEFSTHSAGGITLFDFICAAHIEKLSSKHEFQI